MTGGQELYEVARAQAIPSRWVSMSQAEGLVIEAMGPTISITQPPPRKGTVVRDARGGEQREWALPGWRPPVAGRRSVAEDRKRRAVGWAPPVGRKRRARA